MKYQDPYDPEPTSRLEREVRLRLFEQLHQSPPHEDMVNDFTWRRANGHMRCQYCDLLYREHPYGEEDFQNIESGSMDHRLCDGSIVHL